MTISLVHFNHADNNNLTTWADMRVSNWKPNYGDMLVCAAIVRPAGFGGVELPIDRVVIRAPVAIRRSAPRS